MVTGAVVVIGVVVVIGAGGVVPSAVVICSIVVTGMVVCGASVVVEITMGASVGRSGVLHALISRLSPMQVIRGKNMLKSLILVVFFMILTVTFFKNCYFLAQESELRSRIFLENLQTRYAKSIPRAAPKITSDIK